MYYSLGIDEKLLQEVKDAETSLAPVFSHFESICEYWSVRILNAFREAHVSEYSFFSSCGYGYNDDGRSAVEDVYSKVFGTEKALVRPQMVSGTHAITLGLRGVLRPGDRVVLATGLPYDTMQTVMGLSGNSPSALNLYNIDFDVLPLKDNHIDLEGLKDKLSKPAKMVYFQRSRGYSGGGLAQSGGYLVGKADLVELAAEALTAPGLGSEVGATLNQTKLVLQGLYQAPIMVLQAMKSAALFATVLHKRGYWVSPKPEEKRTDTVQLLGFNQKEDLIHFCQAIQHSSPIDSFVTPEPAPMPGYENEVIMAAGTFVQGATSELIGRICKDL